MGAAAGDFRVGRWLVQPSRNRLTRGGSELRVRPKVMDLLVYLSRHAGEVVSKEDILDGVWAKRIMAESALTGLVSELRRALGDDARGARTIETVSKRGYRLVVPVEPVADEAPTSTDLACVLIVAGRRVPLGEGEHVIGRAPDAAVHVDSTEVSRCHAKIVVRAGRATIEDLGSKNGTFVGGELVGAPRTLRDGDEVRVGGVLMVFRLPYPMQSTMTVVGG